MNSPEMPQNGSVQPEKSPLVSKWVLDILKSALFALIFVVLIRTFIAQPFVVSGQSMEPTFVENEYMIVDQLSYRFDDPKRGDVIVFKYPKDPRTFYIKRIIGLPGETLEIKNGIVTLFSGNESESLTEPYVVNKDVRGIDQRVTLGTDEFFVLGDNRPVSSDSRVWGVLPRENIVGKPFVTLFPFSKIDIYPGIERYNQ